MSVCPSLSLTSFRLAQKLLYSLNPIDITAFKLYIHDHCENFKRPFQLHHAFDIMKNVYLPSLTFDIVLSQFFSLCGDTFFLFYFQEKYTDRNQCTRQQRQNQLSNRQSLCKTRYRRKCFLAATRGQTIGDDLNVSGGSIRGGRHRDLQGAMDAESWEFTPQEDVLRIVSHTCS